MSAMPSWPPGDPEKFASWRTTGGQSGPAPFRGLLGAVAATDPLDPPEISLRFKVGDVHAVVEFAATASLDELVKTTGRRLRRRGYACGPSYRTEIAGLADCRARVVTRKKRFQRPAGDPQFQLYTLIGPYSLILTVAEAQASLSSDFGPLRLDPPVPPAITPVLRMPSADPSSVEEKLILTNGSARLTAVVSPGLVTTSAEDFAITRLESMRSRLPDMAAGDWQPDVFLGGWPCVRHTFVHGGITAGDVVRSEYWWAGVVMERGTQVFVLGTRSIIDLDQARRLQDLAVLVLPG